MTYFADLAQTLAALDPAQLARLAALVRDCTGTVWICGNGGSASTAQHWACDLSKAARRRAVALGANSALLTAYANDLSYGAALAEELKTVGQAGDALVAISCSGTSPNITTVLRQAYLMQIPRALIMGAARTLVTPLDALVNVPHVSYGIIEDCHLAIGHWLTEELRG